MIHVIEIDVEEEIDLEHMLESVSDAAYWSDNVTQQEQELVIRFIQKLINNENKG